jgi:hypothetical protein
MIDYEQRYCADPDTILPTNFTDRFDHKQPWSITLAMPKGNSLRFRCCGYDHNGNPAETHYGMEQAGFLYEWRRLHYNVSSRASRKTYSLKEKKAFAYLGIAYYCHKIVGVRRKGYTKRIIESHYNRVASKLGNTYTLEEMIKVAAKLWDGMSKAKKERLHIQKKPLTYNPRSKREAAA